MRLRREEDEAGEEEIMITPLVDVIFLLLIFFIVTASLKKPIRTWDVSLPTDTYASQGRFHGDEVVITCLPEGVLHVADKQGTREKATMTELRNVLAAAGARVPRPHVRLDVDREARMFQVAEIIDVVRNYQLRDVSFRARDR